MTPSQPHRWAGALWILLAACGYGSMALFANVAYTDGIDTPSLLAWRFLLASTILAGVLLLRRIPLPRGRALASFMGLGVLFAGMAWTYFAALHYASSGLVALLVYVYPVMVAILAALLGLDRFGRPEGLALLVCALGLYLLLGQALHAGRPLGISLALASGLLYALYILGSSRVSHAIDPLAGTWVVMTTAGLLHLAYASTHHPSWPHSSHGWWALLALACLSTVIAINAFLIGLRHIGPTLSSVLSTLEPVITVTLGIVFLGESLSRNALLGSLLVLGAGIGLALARARQAPPFGA